MLTERMSSKKFLKSFEEMWKEGPIVKYRDPDSWLLFHLYSKLPY
jgi:hypothetical protein